MTLAKRANAATVQSFRRTVEASANSLCSHPQFRRITPPNFRHDHHTERRRCYQANSFLHPGAARTLINILKEHKQHQFILSTHSPETIVAAQPEKLFMLRMENEKTGVQELEKDSIDSARQVLGEIGSRFSDVFGADGVVWVEGPTEVECFPMLLGATEKKLAPNIVIARLANTDDLQGKHADIIAEAYRQLSNAGSILPVSIAVSLDGDKQGGRAETILRHACGNVVHFIPRRNYESFLIHVPAITAVLNSLPAFSAAPIDATKVAEWIEDNGGKAHYKADGIKICSPEWYAKIDGSAMLERFLEELSGNKETFRKPLYSVQMTRSLLEHDIESLRQLIDYVSSILPDKVIVTA